VVSTLKEGWSRSKSSSIVVVAEGDEAGNATDIANSIKEQVGDKLDIRVTTLGHIQRGGSPTAYDRILASRLGLGAVEGLLNGHKNEMAGIVNNELVYTPFIDTIKKQKPIHDDLLRMVHILSI
jgi:6-phosphofructokinase 1